MAVKCRIGANLDASSEGVCAGTDGRVAVKRNKEKDRDKVRRMMPRYRVNP